MTKLDGLRAAILEINSMINEARASRKTRGNTSNKRVYYWNGIFDGLVMARAMLTLAEYPNANGNAQTIKDILSRQPKD